MPRRRRALAGLAALSGCVFLVLAAVFWIGTNIDAAEGSDAAWVHALGVAGSAAVLPLVTLLSGLALALIGRRAESVLLVLGVGGAGVLTYLAKGVLQVVGADDDGGRLSDYPSGHAATTTAFAGALATIVFRTTTSFTWRLAALACGGAAILLMSVARVEGGGHTTIDVVGGVALGLFWLAVCLLVFAATRPATSA
jgi:undecaprenyl-diphosphatase